MSIHLFLIESKSCSCSLRCNPLGTTSLKVSLRRMHALYKHTSLVPMYSFSLPLSAMGLKCLVARHRDRCPPLIAPFEFDRLFCLQAPCVQAGPKECPFYAFRHDERHVYSALAHNAHHDA